MSNLITHANNEFRAAGWVDENGKFKDGMQEAICNHVLKLLQVFSDEGHSGSSAPYAINLFKTLAAFEPIVPLTGEDWEWNEVGRGVYQNKRCGRVFKQADRFNGQAYDIEGIVFWRWSLDTKSNNTFKSYYTSIESYRPITFPYKPETKYERGRE